MTTKPLEPWLDLSTPCLIWRGYKATNGYGRVYLKGGKSKGAHRVAWEQMNGAVPAGLVLDHLCRNPACVNPWHLEAVTERENILRGEGTAAIHARKSHCINGHPFSAGKVDRRGKRVCRECQRAHDMKYKQANADLLRAKNRARWHANKATEGA